MAKKHLTILKKISTELDPEHVMLLAYMYYSDKDNKENNQYRFEVRIESKKDLESEIRSNEADCVGDWTWPGIDGMVCSYARRDSKGSAAKALKNWIMKTVPFDEFKKNVSIPWRKKGWVSDGYKVPGSDKQYSLKSMTKEDFLNLGSKRMSWISKRAPSTKPNYLDEPVP